MIRDIVENGYEVGNVKATDPNGDGSQPNNGDLISSWVDKTGQASAAEETNTANQPVFERNALNGLPAIRFDDNAAVLINEDKASDSILKLRTKIKNLVKKKYKIKLEEEPTII